ncbi:MAG TPA: RDD family protein [Acidimicrobiales bacterium]|nr:RDD family protein [Acidimicrobiales bacterium]
MTLDDRHLIPTPEGISLDLVLAGLGSRIAAFVLDLLVQVVFFVLVVVVVTGTLSGGGQTSALVAAGILSATALLDFIGYFVLCEMLWSGRSVGKKAAGLRVVRTEGTSVGFWSSLLRNVTRIVDMMPGFLYLVGSVLILVTPKNQRLGDILGSTMVIRERQAAFALQRGTPFDDPGYWTVPGTVGPSWYAPGGFVLPPGLSNWDVSAVPEQELVLIRRFLANRNGYRPEARWRLAMELAGRVWPLISGPQAPPPPEELLECVMLVKSTRG